MAYDPTCSETKTALKKLIDAALEAAAEEHEADVAGLKKKNKELLGKLKDAEEGKGGNGDSAEVERLDAELRQTQRALKAAERARDVAIEERDDFKATAERETSATRNLLVDNGLTDELAKAKVKPELLPAVKALLKGRVELKGDGDERKAFVDGKPLSEFVKTWSEGDEGKHYIAAPENGGGGANFHQPGNPQGGTKKLSEMTADERKALDPQKLAELVAADKAARKAARPGLRN